MFSLEAFSWFQMKDVCYWQFFGNVQFFLDLFCLCKQFEQNMLIGRKNTFFNEFSYKGGIFLEKQSVFLWYENIDQDNLN